VYPPLDTPPDAPEPPLPGKGPFMTAASFSMAAPVDSPKGMLSWRSVAAPSALTSPALLLKTDGGNAWLEASRMVACGLHTSAPRNWAAAGRGMSDKEQEAANQTR
jgi:hypothetical protein